MNPVHIGVVVGTFPIGMFTASLITGLANLILCH